MLGITPLNRERFVTTQIHSPGKGLALRLRDPGSLLRPHLYFLLASFHSEFPFQSLEVRGNVMNQRREALASNPSPEPFALAPFSMPVSPSRLLGPSRPGVQVRY